MTKLGIIGAMDVEVALLKEKLENLTVVNRTGMVFFEGVLDGLDVVVVQCGVGKVNAALCVQVLCDCFGVTAVVNTGVAGSLNNQLDIGDLVVSRDAMYHDMDVRIFGYTWGQVPGMPEAYGADPRLVELAFGAAETVNPGHTKTGRIASGDQFVCTAEQKQTIIANTGALCTEMEGTAIAHAAYRNGIPFVILRAISDKADGSAEMEYPVFEAIAARRCADVTCEFVKQLKCSR